MKKRKECMWSLSSICKVLKTDCQARLRRFREIVSFLKHPEHNYINTRFTFYFV